MKFAFKNLDDLYRRSGGSYYLLDLEALAANYDRLLKAAERYYTPFKIAYSVKTNYMPVICELFYHQGAFAEVVSDMEYSVALRCGFPADKIIVNGPLHDADLTREVILKGGIFNLDSWYQIPIVKRIAEQDNRQKLAIGVRLNFEINPDARSRFGFDSSTVSMDKLLHELAPLNVNLVSLHCHYCENARSAESYEIRSGKMIELYDRYFKRYDVKYINIGGGFYSKMPEMLKTQFKTHVPTMEEYAEAFTRPFARRFPSHNGPVLVVEPGGLLVADVMFFISKVVDIKSIKDKTYALVDGSIYNIKPTKSPKNMPMHVAPAPKPGKGFKGTCDIAGYTCMEDDIMFRDYNGEIHADDLVVFDNVGAYTNVLKPPFIKPNQPVYAKHHDRVFCVKEQESYEDIFKSYQFGTL